MAAPSMLSDTDQPPAQDAGAAAMPTMQTFLAGAIANGSLPMPDPGPVSNTIYVLYFPSTTTITFDGLTSCAATGFAGYHNHLVISGQTVTYSVVVECPPIQPPSSTSVTPLTELETTTVTASHEVIETASDPDGKTGFGIRTDDVNNWAWLDIVGGDEVADLCVDPFGINQDVTRSMVNGETFAMQRIWSNTSAAAGHDPCAPAPAGQVYFNVAPRKGFFVVDVGQSVTFEADAFADGAIPDWTLFAQDWSASLSSVLTLTIAGGTQSAAGAQIQVNRGKTVRITATLLSDTSSLATGEADGVLVSVSKANPATPVAHWWPFAVMSKAAAIASGIPGERLHAHRPVRRSMTEPSSIAP
jgi:hypothetical protein